jgi:tetratricopeptide (TPR) repeat protein
MMNAPLRSHVLSTALAVALSVAMMPTPASAIPNPFKKKKATVSVPASEELRANEIRAADMYAAAQRDEAGGKRGAAMDAYRKIVEVYPYTSMAPAAQFRIGAGYEAEEKFVRAFEAYQELNDSYRQSPQFSEALERQFRIAMMGRSERISSVFGIKKKLDYEKLVEMLQSVIDNAPQGPNAAEAQMEIAKVYEEEQLADQSITAYKKVADTYPRSPMAAEAAAKVGEGYLEKIRDGSRDMSNVVRAAEATEEAQSLFPTATIPDGTDLSATSDAIGEAAAEASYKTGRFYEKKGNYRAAMIYYADVLKAPGSSHFEEVRDRVNEMSTRDPKILSSAKNLAVNAKELAVPAAVDVKSKPGYFGPPAPVAKVASTKIRKPQMRSGEFMPIIPIEEPDLPNSPPTGTIPDNALLDTGTTPTPDMGAPGMTAPDLSLPEVPASLEPMPAPTGDALPPLPGEAPPAVETIMPAEPVPAPMPEAPTEAPVEPPPAPIEAAPAPVEPPPAPAQDN